MRAARPGRRCVRRKRLRCSGDGLRHIGPITVDGDLTTVVAAVLALPPLYVLGRCERCRAVVAIYPAGVP